MDQQSLPPGGNGRIDTATKSKIRLEDYTLGINSCNAWKDYHNPYPKETEEYDAFYTGFTDALDDLVHAWGHY
jgi:hypothetical protein